MVKTNSERALTKADLDEELLRIETHVKTILTKALEPYEARLEALCRESARISKAIKARQAP